MEFFAKNKIVIQAVMILSEVLDIVIAIIVNLLSQADFSILSPHNLIMCGILVMLVVVHIICSIIQHNATLQARNRKLQKAFLEHGGYDAVAEEMKECIKHRDYRSMKDLRKMVDLVER